MEKLTYMSIEELGLSKRLYTRFKKAGITDVGGIKDFDFTRLTKIELIELANEFTDYDTHSGVSIHEIGMSDALFTRLEKLKIEKVHQIPRVGHNKFNKNELLEIIREFSNFDSYNV